MKRLLFAVMLIVAPLSAAWAERPKVIEQIDSQFASAWKGEGITPAPAVEDDRYLRRAYLDLVGTLPPAEKVQSFVADSDSAKREKLIDELLKHPRYATHWANYWDAVLIGRLAESAVLDRNGFKQWLEDDFSKNVPWNKIVYELLTAEGYNTNRTPKNAKGDPADFQDKYKPATNFFLKYWMSLPELAGATSKTFLGVQIQCAQCHDHKTEKWTQQDFKQFAAFFVKTYPNYYDKTLVLGTPRLETKDRFFMPPTTGKMEMYFGTYKDYLHSTPKLLDGHEPGTMHSRRVELATWVTAKNNPWFAKAIVNRYWALLLGRGFVEPIDDFRPGNPPLLPETLDTLATDFVAHDFDLNHLLRAICLSKPYQLACQGTASSKKSNTPTLWSSFPLKHMEAEVLLDAVLAATDSEKMLDKISNGHLDFIRNAFVRQFVVQMGTDEMSEVTDLGETIPRALLMLNGALWNGTTRMNNGLGVYASYHNTADDAKRIEHLYRQTLSRTPTPEEMKTWVAFVNEKNSVVSTAGPTAGEPVTGLRAMMVSPEISKAPANADFKELIKHAKTGADFKELAKHMKNNADAGLYVKSLREFGAEVPFRMLATQSGGHTAKEQAYEDLQWALLNCSEFLTNH